MGERTSHAPGTFSSVDLATSGRRCRKVLLRRAVRVAVRGHGRRGVHLHDLPSRRQARRRVLRGRRWRRGVPPHWNSYVTVQDVDASVARATELGGSVLMEAQDVAQIGRMAVIADPAGAVALWEPRGMIGAELVNAPGARAGTTSGPPTWTRPWPSTASCSGGPSSRFGGEPAQDPQPRDRERQPVPPGRRRARRASNWLVYFATADLEGSDARVTELGGQVVVDPLEVAAGGRVSVVTDRQGAAFGLFDGPLDPRGAMPSHAAFLRGINLGRNRRVSSAELRSLFAEMGFDNVDTFRTSGNVVFAQARDGGEGRQANRAGIGPRGTRWLSSRASELRAIAENQPFARGAWRALAASSRSRCSTRSRHRRGTRWCGGDGADRLAFGDRELYWLPSGGIRDSELGMKGIEKLVGDRGRRERWERRAPGGAKPLSG